MGADRIVVGAEAGASGAVMVLLIGLGVIVVFGVLRWGGPSFRWDDGGCWDDRVSLDDGAGRTNI